MNFIQLKKCAYKNMFKVFISIDTFFLKTILRYGLGQKLINKNKNWFPIS